MSACKGVNPLTKEECAADTTQQPVGGVGRVPEAIARANDGHHDRAESFVSEAWTGEVPNRTRRQQCMELSSDVVNTITVSSDEAQKIATVPNMLNRGKYTRHRQSL